MLLVLWNISENSYNNNFTSITFSGTFSTFLSQLLSSSMSISSSFFFFAFCFLRPHPQYMKIPRLGVQWELQLPAYTTATAASDPSCVWNLYQSSWQRRILNLLSEARDQTHNLMVPSQIRFRCTTTGTPKNYVSIVFPQQTHTLTISLSNQLAVFMESHIGLLLDYARRLRHCPCPQKAHSFTEKRGQRDPWNYQRKAWGLSPECQVMWYRLQCKVTWGGRSQVRCPGEAGCEPTQNMSEALEVKEGASNPQKEVI